MRLARAVTCVTAYVTAVSLAVAQSPNTRLLTPKDRSAIVDTTASLISNEYLFPDVADKMVDHIRKQQRKGMYDSLTSLQEFAYRLTEELRSISKDRHIGVVPLPPDAMAGAASDSVRTAARKAQELDHARYTNYGFVKVERLGGNVGYIKLNAFCDAEVGGATAVATMNFVGHCDALIFDLRDNGGGQPSMIQLITSYLFESPQHLNSFEIRGQDTPKQFWSHAFVPGPRLQNVPVFVLTSSTTFSGAEEFSYNLQNMKRATIVGEVTGGGAHDTDNYPIYSLGVEIWVPHARAVNPITGSNWEGTGVKPDIECPAAKAFDVAYLEALKIVRSRENDPDRIRSLDWAIEGEEACLTPLRLPTEELQAYVGTYGPRVLTLVGDTLFYQRGDRAKRRLIPLSKHRFALDGTDHVRFEFVADSAGRITEIIGLYEDGYTDRHKRSQ